MVQTVQLPSAMKNPHHHPRVIIVIVVGAALAASGIVACGSDDVSNDPVTTPGTEAGDGGVVQSDGGGDGASIDASDGAAPKPAPGSFMGLCRPGDAGRCDDGLFCISHHESSGEGGTIHGCGVQICTQQCDAGCPLPSLGCAGPITDWCTPPSCL